MNQRLVDFVNRDVFRLDRDFLCVARVFPSQVLYVSVERGAKEHRLARLGLGNEFKDFAKVGIKAHVEHSVGLVDYKEAHAAQVQLAALLKIDDAARSSNDKVNALFNRLNLGLVAHSAVKAEGL